MDNCKNFKLIAHALIKIEGKYLIIRRTKIKRIRRNDEWYFI